MKLIVSVLLRCSLISLNEAKLPVSTFLLLWSRNYFTHQTQHISFWETQVREGFRKRSTFTASESISNSPQLDCVETAKSLSLGRQTRAILRCSSRDVTNKQKSDGWRGPDSVFVILILRQVPTQQLTNNTGSNLLANLASSSPTTTSFAIQSEGASDWELG